MQPIRIGIGGWSYEPWRETFYPKHVTKKQELSYASRQVTAMEINSTYYRAQTPAVYKRWADETPDDFVFTLKAPRIIMERRDAAAAAEAALGFIDGGILEMGEKLGAINWQFRAGRTYDPDYMETFLSALPQERGEIRLRHAIEVRHDTFRKKEFVEQLRKHQCALVSADDPDWPVKDVETTDFAYARLQQAQPDVETGYPAEALDEWAKTFKTWAKKRDVFGFFIAGAKERNPAAAKAMIGRL
ncbi:MAG: DUF72 domain-containing protein [Caulobacterales bacterium]